MSSRIQNIVCITLLFVLLLLPALFAMITATDLEYSWLKKIAYLVVVVLLLLLPLVFLKVRTYFIVEGIFNFFFFPIDIASLYLNKQSTSVAFLQNIINTDIHEASELLLSMWPICLIVLFLWILYFTLTSYVQNTYLFDNFIRKLLLIITPITCISGIVAMIIFQLFVFRSKPIKLVVIDAFDLAAMKLYKIYPYNLYLDIYDIGKSYIQQQQLQHQVASFSFGIHPLNSTTAMYVLVIGETARWDHFSINGYMRETTPYLSQRSNLISFDNAYSQANLTRYSLPLIITRATANNPQLAYKEKTLLEAFQEAGYRIGLLVKQEPSNIFVRTMQICDYATYNIKNISASHNYDEELIEFIQQYTTDSVQFFVLHTLGSHFRYEQRYPKEFECFQPTMGTSFSYALVNETNKATFINAYDNSILYTDYFLDSLISYMESLKRPAVMMYMSDHGESFWDDERKLSLHGSYQISEYEYHVPLIVWYSDEYASIYPKKVQAMQQNKTTPISSDVVFYSMLDIANIKGPVVDSTRSICSPCLLPYDTIWVHTGSGATEQMIIGASNP